jgi:hypothetical protein
MARKPNSMRKVASAAKPKKRKSPIPKDVNQRYMTASRKGKAKTTRRA